MLSVYKLERLKSIIIRSPSLLKNVSLFPLSCKSPRLNKISADVTENCTCVDKAVVTICHSSTGMLCL